MVRFALEAIREQNLTQGCAQSTAKGKVCSAPLTGALTNKKQPPQSEEEEGGSKKEALGGFKIIKHP
jgi:hypothetical protein